MVELKSNDDFARVIKKNNTKATQKDILVFNQWVMGYSSISFVFKKFCQNNGIDHNEYSCNEKDFERYLHSLGYWRVV